MHILRLMFQLRPASNKKMYVPLGGLQEMHIPDTEKTSEVWVYIRKNKTSRYTFEKIKLTSMLWE